MLKKLKILLGISDNDLDERLNIIIDNATLRLKSLLGGIEPPDSMSYIILDVATMRFNKVGSEGMSSHSVDGESISFVDDDFSAYKEDIQSFLDSQKDSKKGKVRFL